MLIKQLSIFLENKKGPFYGSRQDIRGGRGQYVRFHGSREFRFRYPSPNRIRYGESDIRAS